MKKKSLIKSCLLCASLMLGTGYAIINNRVLTATGTVPIGEKDLNVGFIDGTGYTVSNGGATATLTIDTIDESDITLPAGTPVGNHNVSLNITNNETDISVKFDVNVKFSANGETLTSDVCNASSVSITYYDDHSIPTDVTQSPLLPQKSAVADIYYDFYTPALQYSQITIVITITAHPYL